MTAEDGPRDPFLDDPDDPAALLEDAGEDGPVEPLSEQDRTDVLADLADLARFRSVLEPRGLGGIAVDCGDCGDLHFFGWDLMAANLRALLGHGRTHVHEPAFDPDPDTYVSWDYARGYCDALSTTAPRQRK